MALRELSQRPYHVESTGSRPINAVKQRWAWLVLGWVNGPGVDSASNRNEYQVYFLGVKAAGV